jgi:CBS domain-containing protein
VHWLGYINLMLLVFNMLPALPLDGGRVLRASLWQVKGDFLAATRAAAALGRAFGQVLIFGGVILAFSGAGIGGLWLAFIGWFLLIAAEAEANAAIQHEALAGMRVADAMVAQPVTVPGDLTIEQFVDDIVLVHRHTVYPVTDGERALGLVAFREATRVPRETWPAERVRDHLHPAADTLRVAAGDPLEDVWPQLSASPLRRALVLDGDRLAGLLSAVDVGRILEIAQVSPRAGTADTRRASAARTRSPAGSSG